MAEIELLSPGGSMESLKAAVQSGADAVYVGGPLFGARQSATNFSLEELREATDYCHVYGVDIHVTLNTLIKETELSQLEEYIRELCKINVDAIIVQDMGVAEYIKQICPEMTLHASTQMTVTSLEGVRYLEEMGFSRVVLARELSKEEIAYICKRAKAEIEVFVHGAICMSYSGQCLMSSILGGRSGNRGRCAQPCRLMYTLTDGKEKQSAYVLSPKDMALVRELNELKKIGVKSLKIEGRLKRSEYVSAVTGIYRKYLDSGEQISDADMKELTQAFSRTGFTDGYFTKKLGKGMMCHQNPSNAEKNFYTPEAIRRTQGQFIRKTGINISASLEAGEPLHMTMYDNDGNYASVESESVAQVAVNAPLGEERLKSQLQKLGQTPFEAQSIDVFVGENATIAISEINDVRRKAAALLWKQRAAREPKQIFDIEKKEQTKTQRKQSLVCEVRTSDQLKAAIECGVGTIVVPRELVHNAAKFEGRIIQKCTDIFTKEEILAEEIEVSNPAQVQYYKDVKKHGGMRLNVCNSEAAGHYSYLEDITLSPELNIKEINALIQNTDAHIGIIAYGRISLMLMKNCPIKAMGKCAKGRNSYKLIDRKREEFPLLCKENCVCEIVNSKPLFMADKFEDIPKVSFLRLLFTTEDYAQSKRIIELYQNASEGKAVKNPFGENEFTRGHLYRGVL